MASPTAFTVSAFQRSAFQRSATHPVQLLLADPDVPWNQLVLRQPEGDVGIAIAHAIEAAIDVVVGNAEEQHAAIARVHGARRQQHALVFEVAQVGAVLFGNLDDLLEEAAIADDGDGVHQPKTSRACSTPVTNAST